VSLIFFVGQFELADSLYARGYYDLARVEYERVFFYYPDSFPDRVGVRLNLAVARLKTDESSGRETLDSLSRSDPELIPQIQSILARFYLETNNFLAADEFAAAAGDLRLQGLAQLKDGRLIESRAVFIESREDKLAAAVNEYLARPRKSAVTAAVLSFLCPGAGEIYGGNFRLGVMDLLLNAGSGFLLYNALRQRQYVDAGLVISFLINRFYFGSIHNAQKTAEDYNERKFKRWLAGIEAEYYSEVEGSKKFNAEEPR